ncbi:MAG: malto-oligosyltrehalose trehalohydrolase [Oscillochloris sp.]|nr:malto-oligosyltrehalose trehalohydrolase [Oscillochloris sp.]
MPGITTGRPPTFATPPGATVRPDGGVDFVVWAPLIDTLELVILDSAPRYLAMERDAGGYWRAFVSAAAPGTRYRYRLNGSDQLPDPASRCQPEGVHGPSEVVDTRFAWSDQRWFGTPLSEYVVYELHVGAFTPEGTFDAIIPHLPALKELGISAIELLPVAHFPGERNWGYDGVYLYAPHTAYGGVAGLQRLVDAAHNLGLAVILDVVYNHFGPEGNYLWAMAQAFFTDRYKTPWGDAINYDGPDSDPVRHFVIANALYWLREFHIDALRLDAVHAIFDFSAYHILEEMADAAHAQSEQLNRRAYLIAESDLNDPRLIRPNVLGGYGLDAQWADDYHHAIHSFFTGEQMGYYQGFGGITQLAAAIRQAYVYAGDFSPHRARRFGRRPADVHARQFVVCAQNHDQVGNRALGDRLTALIGFDQLKLVAALTGLSPFVPMLFMGEEYAEPAPFQYFTDHSDPELLRNVREGRKQEFAEFVPAGEEVPDPQDPATLARSTLNLGLREQGRHKVIFNLYRELLHLRRTIPALAPGELGAIEVQVDAAAQTLLIWRYHQAGDALLVLNLGAEPAHISLPPGDWHPALDSSGPEWAEDGSGRPTSGAGVLESGITLAAQSFVLLHTHSG